MKKNKTILFLVLTSSFLLSACGQNDSKQNEPIIPFQEEVNLLKKGFEVKGTIDIHTDYFKDIYHFRPSDLKEADTTTIDFKLIYEDSPDYIGSDRRFYKTVDGKRKFLLGENIFNDAGYVGMNYVDYENVVRRDGYASDDNGNSIPYSVSGYINPFKLINGKDFLYKDDKITLTESKASIFATTMFGELDEVEENIVVNSSEFNFDKNILKNAVLKSNVLNSTESIKVDGQWKNIFAAKTYTFKLNFDNVGNTDAYNAVKPEASKPENQVLNEAIQKFEDGNYTSRRHLKAFDLTNNEYVKEEQCIDVYYSNSNHAIYQSIYDYNFNKSETGQEYPISSSESDILFYDIDDDDTLNTFVSKMVKDEEVFVPGAPYYPAIEELFSFESLLLCYTPVDETNYGFVDISGDVFNKNEDGSYSPIDDNIPYMANDCFVSQLQTTEEIAGGLISEFKIFLKNVETDPVIDKIELKGEFGPYIHNITMTYEDFGITEIPFGAFDKIQKEAK